MVDAREAITQAHRDEWARVVAVLARRYGDLDVAEEATAEAVAIAATRWPTDGVPPNPGGRLEAQMWSDDAPDPNDTFSDERLRLIFTCCHPAIAMESRVALTLRMVGGLTVPEIARAFLVSEVAMGQRITRAKAKIKAARIPCART